MDLRRLSGIVFITIFIELLVLCADIHSQTALVTPAPSLSDILEKSCAGETDSGESSQFVENLIKDEVIETETKPPESQEIIVSTPEIVPESIDVKEHYVEQETVSSNHTFVQNFTKALVKSNVTIYDWRLVFLNSLHSKCSFYSQATELQNKSHDKAEDASPDPFPPTDIFESFEEWKKNKIEEAQNKKEEESPESVEPRPMLRKQKKLVNYASQDCGSKILNHNKEAKHVFAILDENKDLYMLNPCSSSIWFVIELCEPIQVQTIHLSNLELFSSSPNEFVVSVSERYPTREWTVLDKFKAANQRNLQVFNHEGHDQMFAKYIKFEMLSHFGNEHFCPLTMVRVFGISMVEVYESHSEQDKEEEEKVEANKSASGKEESQDEGTFNTVMNMVKTAIGMDRKENGKKDDGSDQVEDSANDTETIEGNTDDETVWESPVELVENMTSDSLIVLVQTGMGELVTQPNNFFKIPICTPSFYKHVHPIAKTVNIHMCWFLEFVCKVSLVSCFFPSNFNHTDASSLSQYLNFKNVHRNFTYHKSPATTSTNIKNEISNEAKTVVTEVKQPIEPTKSPAVVLPEFDVNDVEFNTESKTLETQALSEAKPDKVITHEERNVDETDKVIVPAVRKQNSTDSQNFTVSHVNETNTTLPVATKNSSEITDESLVINPGGSQKESVFMRLSNRIRILEKNMSLSSAYLENLSQRYKKQVDELQKAFNKTINKLIETSKTADENDKKQTELIHLAEVEILALSTEMSQLAQSGELLNRHLIERHLFFILIEVIVFISVLTFCVKRHNMSVQRKLEIVENKMQKFEKLLKKTEYNITVNKTGIDTSPNLISLQKVSNQKKKRKKNGIKNISIVPPTTISNSVPETICDKENMWKNEDDFNHDTNRPLIIEQSKEWAKCDETSLFKSRV